MRLVPGLLALTIVLAPASLGQVWVLDQRDGSVAVGFTTTSATERFDHRGGRVAFDEDVAEAPGSSYRAQEFFLSLRYEVLEGLQASLHLPLRRVTVQVLREGDVVEQDDADLGDALLGVQLDLTDRIGLPSSWDFAAGFGLKLPLGYRRNALPAVGSGQIDADLVVGAGHRLLDDRAEVRALAGFRFRSDLYALSRSADCPPGTPQTECVVEHDRLRFSDQMLLGLDAAYVFLDRLELGARLDVEWSLAEPRLADRRGGVFLPEWFTEQRVARAGARIVTNLFGETHLALRLSAPVYGQNAAAGTTWHAALLIAL